MEFKEGALEDTELLAEMNKHLIEDEKADNSMNIIQLKDRMIDFLNNGYKAFLFIVDMKTVGYALCDMTRTPIYLRQFFIKREERRKHYGKNAFNKLIEKLAVKEMEIDVLKCDEAGMKFWEDIGFKDLWKQLRYRLYR